MSDDYSCPDCGDTFDSENSLKQHRQAKHDVDYDQTSFMDDLYEWGPTLVGTVIVLLIGYFGYGWLSTALTQPNYPTTDDHWHADYSIVVCGEKVPPRP
jgi:uncharacterized membrane protein YvbJ